MNRHRHRHPRYRRRPHARSPPDAGTQAASLAFHGRVLPFDERAPVRYADIVTGRERIGRPIGVAGAQIAAICGDSGATLATGTISGFEETGIELIDPWKLG